MGCLSVAYRPQSAVPCNRALRAQPEYARNHDHPSGRYLSRLKFWMRAVMA